MSAQIKVAGVVLAGGLARRMNNQDKGLVNFKGRPMISYALAALAPAVDQLFINANRNVDQYLSFGYPVISDQTDNFDGPLAGVLTAMIYADAKVLLVMPCDSPLIKTEHMRRLFLCHQNEGVDVAVAFDGIKMHPVFLAIKTALQASLQDYLLSGQRKVELWLEQQSLLQVNFSDEPYLFSNINTMSELSILEGVKPRWNP